MITTANPEQSSGELKTQELLQYLIIIRGGGRGSCYLGPRQLHGDIMIFLIFFYFYFFYFFFIFYFFFFELRCNETSVLMGHFVSSAREREKKDRRDSRGDDRE